MSDDLIKRSDAIKIMACEMYAEAQSQGYEVDSIEDFMPEAKAWMNDAPSAQPKQGEWIPVTNGRGGKECSLCHTYAPSYMTGEEHLTDYCPNCGARMKGADDE